MPEDEDEEEEAAACCQLECSLYQLVQKPKEHEHVLIVWAPVG